MARERPHILIIAWLIAPGMGSEYAAAWGMARVAAEIGDVTILCREDCVQPIEDWRAGHREAPIDVVPVTPLHDWAIPLMEKLPKGFFLSYLAWLGAVPAVAALVHRRRPVSLAVHAALGCYWLPSPVADLGVPAVWGSVGGATPPAPGLSSVLGMQGMFERGIERVAISIGARLPATLRTMRASQLVLIENETTRPALPADVAVRAKVFNRALLTDVPRATPLARGQHVLFPSTLTARKGAVLALEAFTSVPEPHRLVFANGGPEEARLRRRAIELGIEHRVEFRGKVGRDEYFALLGSAAVTIFLGINEDGGCALCEAMLLGSPVVVLAHSGPKEIVERWSRDPQRVIAVPPTGGPTSTAVAIGNAIGEMIARAPARSEPYLDRDGAIAELREFFVTALNNAVPGVAQSAQPTGMPVRRLAGTTS